jgi:hypothetical protein
MKPTRTITGMMPFITIPPSRTSDFTN